MTEKNNAITIHFHNGDVDDKILHNMLNDILDDIASTSFSVTKLKHGFGGFICNVSTNYKTGAYNITTPDMEEKEES